MKTRKILLSLLLCVVCILSLVPFPAGADTGPKPSVRITFRNMGDQLCYGTLLSKEPSTGPASAWDGDEEHIYNYGYDMEIWRAFVEYQDTDGFYFLQEVWQVNETGELAWTYYPPSPFKILLYYPETGTFVVSGVYERYAFDSYFTVDMEGVQIGSVEQEPVPGSSDLLTAQRSYNYGWELVSLLARIVITILVELAVALLFGFREKKQLLLLAGVNTVTQVLLNVLLNIINYRSGPLSFILNYILFELIVFAVEAVLYCLLMNRVSQRKSKSWLYVVYALVANGVSFGVGLVLAQVIPGIF